MNKIILIHTIIFTLHAIIVTETNKFRVINRGFVSPKILYPASKILRRSADSKINDVYVSVGNWTLKTRVSSRLTSPKINWISSDLRFTNLGIKNVKSAENCTVLNGHVQKTNFQSIVTICDDNFYIIVFLNLKTLTLYPTTNGSHILQEIRAPKIRRHSRNFNDLTEDTFDLYRDLGPTNVQKKPSFEKDKSSLNFTNSLLMYKYLGKL